MSPDDVVPGDEGDGVGFYVAKDENFGVRRNIANEISRAVVLQDVGMILI